MAELEAEGRLDRAVEGLPDPAALAERQAAGRALTRPELAVLLAYGKLELKRDFLATRGPDDPYFETRLVGYFPDALHRYADGIRKHRLRREIIATVFANDVVNRCGPTFPSRLIAAAGCDVAAFAAGYEAAKAVLEIEPLWEAVATLDGKAPAEGQMALFRQIAQALRGATFWLARRAFREGLGVQALIARYAPGFGALKRLTPDTVTEVEKASIEDRWRGLVELGAPREEARAVAILQSLTTAADLVDLAEASSWSVANVSRIYNAAGGAFAFDRLRSAAGTYRVGDTFERTALRRLIEDMLAEQTQLARAIMGFAGSEQAGADAASAKAAVGSWAALRRDQVRLACRTIEEIDAAGGPWTFAKLTIANAALRELAGEAAKGRGKRA
jgi:glutamate dehydrogenase